MILDIPSTPPEVAEPQPPPAFHVLEGTHELELKLARGLVLQVAGQAEGAKHIQFSPTAPHRPAELIGTLQVPAASSIASVIMRMYCVVEQPSSAASPAPTTSEPTTLPESKPDTSAVIWKAISTNHVPKSDKVLSHPFKFLLPARLGQFDAPPSFQRDSFGVRYFLETIVERKRFSLKRNCHEFIPITYLPLHQPPSLEDPRPPEKGSPALPPKDPKHRYSEVSTRIDGAFVWCSALLTDKGVAARGEPYSVLISVACGPNIADSIIPSCFSVKLKELGQPLAEGSSTSRTVVKASEITYHPSHLLPRPSAMHGYAVGAMDYRAYKATLEIGDDVTPSFSLPSGPRAEYEIELKVRIPRAKDQVLSSRLTVVNCSTKPCDLPKAYLKRDAKGGMKMMPELK